MAAFQITFFLLYTLWLLLQDTCMLYILYATGTCDLITLVSLALTLLLVHPVESIVHVLMFYTFLSVCTASLSRQQTVICLSVLSLQLSSVQTAGGLV